MDAALPFTIPCAGPAGFRPFAATLGRVMRLGFAVTARLDLGPIEVLRGATVKKIINIDIYKITW